MERKRVYRILLILVLFLTLLYTLGLIGMVPFRVSYYITLLMILIFVALRSEARGRGGGV